MILAGILLKMGTYGILRINYPMLPAATADLAFWFLAALGAWNIVYGGLCAMAQTDMKKLVAYSSVSHMGYVMLGMAAFKPRASTARCCRCSPRHHHRHALPARGRDLRPRPSPRDHGFGGLAGIMPVYAGFTALAVLRLHGASGALGLRLRGAGAAGGLAQVPCPDIVAALGIVITAGYMLWMMQRVYLGPPNEKYRDLPEINGREIFTLFPLGAIVVIVGVYPRGGARPAPGLAQQHQPDGDLAPVVTHNGPR